ncbi:MAG: hypothetical protein ACREEM_22275, partial [Blastocatellia bacterium]
VCTAPFSIASGAVGFSNYTRYLWPAMTAWQGKLLAAGLCLAVTALLYRDIRTIGRLSVVLWVVVLLTVGWVLAAGLRRHAHPPSAPRHPAPVQDVALPAAEPHCARRIDLHSRHEWLEVHPARSWFDGAWHRGLSLAGLRQGRVAVHERG